MNVPGRLRRPPENQLATVSTLWHYINRAMTWNAPKSLTDDENCAFVAYLPAGII